MVTNFGLEHLDDIILYDCQRAVMVAVMAMCVDWVLDCRCFHLLDRSDWCYLPYFLSGGR